MSIENASADPLVQAAVKRLGELQQQVAVLKRFLADYTSETKPAGQPRLKRDSGRVLATLRAVHDILHANGNPMNRTRLMQALNAAGIETPGREPEKNLGTLIWRSKRFVRLPDGYWPIYGPNSFDDHDKMVGGL